MIKRFKTNKLACTINRDLIDDTYDIFQICTSDEYFARGAFIIDAPKLNKNVHSVMFESGNVFYVLMNKEQQNMKALKETLEDVEGADRITMEKVSAIKLSESTILQLLLNSIGPYEGETLRYSNLTGHFYCFHPRWIKRKEINGKNQIVQVPTLEVKITHDLHFNLDVHTFTSELLKDQIEFKKKKFEQYSKYLVASRNTLRRKLKDDKGYTFIMRQIRKKKSTVAFLKLGSLGQFKSSKMGVLATIIDLFNASFKNMAHIELTDIENYESLDYAKAITRENKRAIKERLSKRPIQIIDCIQDDYSEYFCEEIAKLLKNKWDLPSVYGTEVSKDHLNIRAIHNQDYYKPEDDPYKVYTNMAVQHVTFEDFKKSGEIAISTVVHEILMKDDIANRQITIFDWTSMGFKEDITFAMPIARDKIESYYFMKIHPDGSFEISKQEYDLLNESEYDLCLDIFDKAKEDEQKICGMIEDSSGNINIIRDTGWITIPEIYEIRKELASGNNKLRNKEKRDLLLSASLDIKMMREDNSIYYCVGAIGDGMNSAIQCAANIRKIETYEDSELLFDKMLPLMNLTFVRNGQLTVLPFPFKYLKEYIRANHNNPPKN